MPQFPAYKNFVSRTHSSSSWI